MIQEIKLSFRMLKYAYGLKTNILLGLLIGGLGFLIEFLSHGSSWIGGFFIMAMGMFGVQFLYCVSLSNLVLSSAYRKRLQTSMPACMNLWINLIVFTILIILHLIFAGLYPQDGEKIMINLLFMSIMGIVFSAYISLAYKYFIASMIIIVVISGMLGGFFGIRSTGLVAIPVLEGEWFVSPVFVIPVTYICVFAGAGLQYLISLAIHKKPLSKRAQGAGMKRYL